MTASTPARVRTGHAHRAWGLLVGAVAGLPLVALVLLVAHEMAERERATVTAWAEVRAHALELSLDRRFALLDGLRAWATLHGSVGQEDRDAREFAASLRAASSGIRALQYVEHGVIRFTWPLEGNEAALGYDLTASPQPMVRRDYLRAENSTAVVLSGPVTLVQGGTGLIARRSVNRVDGMGRVVAVVLDLAALLEDAGITRVNGGVVLELADENGVTIVPPAVPAADAGHAVEVAVNLTDRAWMLRAWPVEGWGASYRQPLVLMVVLVVLLCALLSLQVSRELARRRQLEDAVQVRTRNLADALDALREETEARARTQDALQQAARMEGLGRLAGGVAHDFNNLLTAMLGFVGLVRPAVRGRPEAEDLAQLERTIGRATELTRQLLAFARQLPVNAQRVDASDVVRGVEGLLRRFLRDNIELRLDLAVPGASILVDPSRLEQVLTNLVMNAVDAMPDGGVVTLRTSVVDRLGNAHDERHPGPWVVLSVSDTGVGMDEHTRSHIFEPFFTTKATGRGTGLGLATSQNMVRQAGGIILVESDTGAGSTFRVCLPRSDRPTLPVGAPGHDGVAGGTETILLVDDEPALRDAVARSLRTHGYRVVEAEDGQSALAVAAAHAGTIHAVITDARMPRMAGPQLLDALSRARPGIRTMLVTGHMELDGTPLPPSVVVLHKPFDLDALLRALRRLLDAPPPPPDGAMPAEEPRAS